MLYELLQDPPKDGAVTDKKLVQTPTISSQIEAIFYHLIGLAEQKKTRTYKQICEVAELNFTHHRQVEAPLNTIEKICLEQQVPALNELVVKANTGLPSHYKAGEHVRWEVEKKKIFDFDWASIIEDIDFDRHQ